MPHSLHVTSNKVQNNSSSKRYSCTNITMAPLQKVGILMNEIPIMTMSMYAIIIDMHITVICLSQESEMLI